MTSRTGYQGQRPPKRARVERVDPVEAAPDANDLPTRGTSDPHVLALGVTEHQGGDAAGHQAADDSLGEAGLPYARRAHDDHSEVGDQPGFVPAEGVAAHAL